MKQVNIPFTALMGTLAIADKKTCTSRNRRYGYAGDLFFIRGIRFVLNKVEQATLKRVRAMYHMTKGFTFPRGFEDYWNIVHPRKGFQPEQLVWVHWFEKTKEASHE